MFGSRPARPVPPPKPQRQPHETIIADEDDIEVNLSPIIEDSIDDTPESKHAMPHMNANPFALTTYNPFADEQPPSMDLELGYIGNNPFADDVEPITRPFPSKPSSILSALLAQKDRAMQQLQQPSSTGKSKSNRYQPFSADADENLEAGQHSRPQPQQQHQQLSVKRVVTIKRAVPKLRPLPPVPAAPDSDSDEEVPLPSTQQSNSDREKGLAKAQKARNKFRASLHGLEQAVDRTGEQEQQHCVDESKPNAVIRFLLSNRVFGYPGSKGTLWSNYICYVCNQHPTLSLLFLHKQHVYTRKHRLLVACNALCLALFLSFLLLDTHTFHPLAVCEEGCHLSSTNSTTNSTTTNSSDQELCSGGYNDGLSQDNYDSQCRYYHPLLPSLAAGLFVMLYSSAMQFFATCSCMQGHRSCQANPLGRGCKSYVETCGGSVLALFSLVSMALLLATLLGTLLQKRTDKWALLQTSILSKVWASIEWFAYSLPFFALRYPADRRYFYQQLERRRSKRPESAATPAPAPGPVAAK